MQTVARLAISLLVTAYLAASTAMAANALLTGVTSENGLACNSVLFDVIIPLLRKNDPTGHKLITNNLKNGNCIEISGGSPITILGKDDRSTYSRDNYLIWHSNGKVYSMSDRRVTGVSPIPTQPTAVASPIRPISNERVAPPHQEPSIADKGGFWSYPIGAGVVVAIALFVFKIKRSRLRRWPRSNPQQFDNLHTSTR